MEKHKRFLDLYHDGEVSASEIDDYIDRWHDAPSGPERPLEFCVELHVYLGMAWDEWVAWGGGEGELPEREGRPRHDLTFVTDVGQALVYADPLRTHGPVRCRPACPIHWPTEHAGTRWPHGWRPDEGIMTRICPHGCHHPDPDDQQVRLHPDLGDHSCDGCCKPTIDGEVRAALTQLDGTPESAVALLTGIPRAELEQYGGRPA